MISIIHTMPWSISVFMVDKERIARKFRSMEEYADRINKILPKDPGLYAKLDQNLKIAVERYLQLVSEKEFDLLSQLYAELNLGIVGDSNSLLKLFEEKFSNVLIKSIGELKELRNLLVHSYSLGQYDKRVFEAANRTSKDVELLKKETAKLIS